MTHKQDWQGQNITVIGLGIEGEDLARYFARHGARVTVSDVKSRAALGRRASELEALGVRLHLGANDVADVATADLVCVSQSVPLSNPLVAAAGARGVRVESMTSLFLQQFPGPVAGITGSSGKTTTTNLVDAIFRAAGREHVLGGNLGIGIMGLLDQVDDPTSAPDTSRPGPSPSPKSERGPGGEVGALATKSDALPPTTEGEGSPQPPWAVLEISHTQLVLTERSPNVAALLNVTPNHLDQFSWDEYVALKRKIFEFQRLDDSAVFNADDPVSRELRPEAKSRVYLFSVQSDHGSDGAFLEGGTIFWRRDVRTERVVESGEVPLRGFHNVANAAAATAIAAACDIGPEAVATAIRGFKAPDHRLEFVASVGGVAYYNDSIATAPERTLAALRSFEEPIVLLLGGRDKKLPLDEMMGEAKTRCRSIVTFGESGHLFADAAEALSIPTDRVETLAQAVEAASRRAQPGDVVLLSPACTSFDAYANFEQRGIEFRRLVRSVGGAGDVGRTSLSDQSELS